MNDLELWLDGAAQAPALAGLLKPVAYLALALAYAVLAQSRHAAQWCSAGVVRSFHVLLPVYLLVCSSSLLRGDLLFVQWAREQAQGLQVYEARRWIQGLALLAAAALALAVWQRRPTGPAQAWRRAPGLGALLIWCGLVGTVLLFALRYLSFHYTDVLLDRRLAGHSMAAWLEAVALAMPVLGTWLDIAQNYEPV